MKNIEIRQTKGFCRLCECTSEEDMVVIPFRYSGKNAPIFICLTCIDKLATLAREHKQ